MNDLALLETDIKPKDKFDIAPQDAKLLDDIYVAGYPFGQAVSSSVKVTKGVVSALTGIGNNYSNIRMIRIFVATLVQTSSTTFSSARATKERERKATRLQKQDKEDCRKLLQAIMPRPFHPKTEGAR